MPSRRSTLLICLFLGVVTLAVYWPVTKNDFVNFDDDLYVTENRHVKAGLTQEGIRQVFMQPMLGFWHPLTMLSHMLDCQLFGLNPAGHHFTNVFLHIANTILLFLAFKGMTGVVWRSAFVAALFALHPLRVESVAWVSERKDVLSTFFWMLTLLAYVQYAKRPGLKTYVVILLLFVLGLMSKPMLVTLPFVLLLLDWWPLKRTEEGGDARFQHSPYRRLVMEKVPLIAFSGIASLLALWSQLTLNAIAPLSTLPFQFRVANALLSYVKYLEKTLFPHDLAVFYPLPGMLPYWKTAGAAIALFLISFMVIRSKHLHPYLLVGWLWFLGTLVPVIGLVQVGQHAMADRFTYVPLIGLFVMVSWGVPEFFVRYRYARSIPTAISCTVLAALAVVTWHQVAHWRNSVTLFEQALRSTRDNLKAHINLGAALAFRGRVQEAEEQYRMALKIAPYAVVAHNNLGNLLADQGRGKEAMSHYEAALRLRPDYAKTYNSIGHALVREGRLREAIKYYKKAIEINPDFVDAMNNLGRAFSMLGELDQAILQYRKAVSLLPDSPIVLRNLGVSLAQKGLSTEAEEAFKRAIQMNPQDPAGYNGLATFYAAGKRFEEAIRARSTALSLEPNNGAAHYRIAVEYYFNKDYRNAIAHCDRAIMLGYGEIEPAFLEELKPFRKGEG